MLSSALPAYQQFYVAQCQQANHAFPYQSTALFVNQKLRHGVNNVVGNFQAVPLKCDAGVLLK
jgi:hypothetical protein